MVHNPSTRLKRIAITLCSTRSVLLISAQTAAERCIYGDAGGVDWGGASGMLGGYWRQQWGRWRFFLRENWLLYGYGNCSGGVDVPLWRPLWSLVSVSSGVLQ